MSSEIKKEKNSIKNTSSKIFENEEINKDNIKVNIQEEKSENKNNHKSKSNKKNDIKNKKKKVKFSKKIDVTNVESWKAFNAENTVEPREPTTKCTCEIF
jgi:hypothetical protein